MNIFPDMQYLSNSAINSIESIFRSMIMFLKSEKSGVEITVTRLLSVVISVAKFDYRFVKIFRLLTMLQEKDE